jgi:hypothetical protein
VTDIVLNDLIDVPDNVLNHHRRDRYCTQWLHLRAGQCSKSIIDMTDIVVKGRQAQLFRVSHFNPTGIALTSFFSRKISYIPRSENQILRSTTDLCLIIYDHIRSYEKSYGKPSSQIADMNSYTKSRIWPNNTILHDHIRSYSKILINLFSVTYFCILLHQI